MREFTFLIKDWGGTYQDDAGDIYKYGVVPIFRHFGKPAPTFEQFRSLLGADFMGFYHHFGIPESATPKELNDIMHAEMAAHDNVHVLFDDALYVTRELVARGKKLVLVSTYDQEKLDAALERTGMMGTFDAVRAGVRGGKKAGVFAELMREFGVTPEETAVVGDMVDDAVAAHQVGAVPFICHRGCHSKERILAAREQVPTLVCIDTLADLLDHVR